MPVGTATSCPSTLTSTERGVRGVVFGESAATAFLSCAPGISLLLLLLWLISLVFASGEGEACSLKLRRLRRSENAGGGVGGFSGVPGGAAPGSAGALAEPRIRRLRLATPAAPTMGGVVPPGGPPGSPAILTYAGGMRLFTHGMACPKCLSVIRQQSAYALSARHACMTSCTHLLNEPGVDDPRITTG